MGPWGSCYNIPKAIFYLLEGDYRLKHVLAAPKQALTRLPGAEIRTSVGSLNKMAWSECCRHFFRLE